MEPTQTQDISSSDSNPSKKAQSAAASLAFATTLSDNIMKEHGGNQNEQQNGQQTPQNDPEQTKEPKPSEVSPKDDMGSKLTEFELNITKKLDDIRKEMKDDQQRELGQIKKDISDALNEEDSEEN